MNLADKFKQMGIAFGVSDKEVLKAVRTMTRSAWGDSVFKQTFLNNNMIQIMNTNPRSKKRFPVVNKYKCAICGNYFGSREIELDHVVDENELTSFDHINSFVDNILFPKPEDLQILCKDKKSKGVVTRFGCHSVKTYASRYGVSLERALCEKKTIIICKKKLDKDWLIEHNAPVPTTQNARRELIVELMMKDLETNEVSKEI